MRFIDEHLGERFTDLEVWKAACEKHHDHVIGQEHNRYFAFHSNKLHSYDHRIGFFYCNHDSNEGTGWLMFPQVTR